MTELEDYFPKEKIDATEQWAHEFSKDEEKVQMLKNEFEKIALEDSFAKMLEEGLIKVSALRGFITNLSDIEQFLNSLLVYSKFDGSEIYWPEKNTDTFTIISFITGIYMGFKVRKKECPASTQKLYSLLLGEE